MVPKAKTPDTQIGGLYAVIARGKNKGIKLYPHRHEDGMYMVSPAPRQGNAQPVVGEKQRAFQPGS
jgi:hypothetical protein